MISEQSTAGVVSHVARDNLSLPSPLDLRLDEACTDTRCTLEAQIAERFASEYNATLSHFLPLLLSLRQFQKLTTVVGLRPAGREALYLERYLDVPVEQRLGQSVNAPVERRGIVEIGNLVSTKQGASLKMFAILALVLQRAGFDWVVCTATRQVHKMLTDFGFATHVMCHADATRIDSDTTWGSYYETGPKVIAGNLQYAAGVVQSIDALSPMLSNLEPQISHLVEVLRHTNGQNQI